VFRLPTTCFAEENGALVSSARAAMALEGRRAAGRGAQRLEIMSELFLRMRKMYQKDGGKFPDPIVNLTWPYANPESPTPEELAMEYNGKALADLPDPRIRPRRSQEGRAARRFAQLRTTAPSGCWIFCGAGRRPATRWRARQRRPDRHRPDAELGLGLAGQPALYNRASCDVRQAVRPEAQADRLERQAWGGADVPDFKADEPPENGMGPFIMNPEGVARFFARGDGRRPVPRALRAVRDAARRNPLHPDNPQALNNPAARVQGRPRVVRQGRRVPARRDHLPPDRAFPLLDQARAAQRDHPARAVRRDRRGLAKEVGIAHRVKVSSKRGYIEAVAVVTKRIKPLTIDGKTVHTVGIPIHWGFGVAKPGYLANTLTVRRRRQLADAGVQVVPGQGRKGVRRKMSLQSLDIKRARPPRRRRPGARTGDREVAKLIDDVPSASAARPARRRAWSGTTCATRSAPTSASTTIRPT
jgi:formate dehydrogenase major subunit